MKLINRQEDNVNNKGSNKLWEPRKQSRVCSLHFKDGMPTTVNPYPTEELGYTNTLNRETNIVGNKRRVLVKTVLPPKKNKRPKDNIIPEHADASVNDASCCMNDEPSVNDFPSNSRANDDAFSILTYYTCYMFFFMANIINMCELIIQSLNHKKRLTT